MGEKKKKRKKEEKSFSRRDYSIVVADSREASLRFRTFFYVHTTSQYIGVHLGGH